MKILEFVPERQTECSVEAWLHIKSGYTEEEMKDFPAIIICPGGAYMDVARREGEPVAAAFYGAGYHTFILRYSIGERAKNFEPLCQLAAAMAYIRSHAKEWHVLPDKITVLEDDTFRDCDKLEYVELSENIITIGNGIGDNTNCINIVNGVKIAPLHIHFTVYTVYRFNTTLVAYLYVRHI